MVMVCRGGWIEEEFAGVSSLVWSRAAAGCLSQSRMGARSALSL